MVLPVAQRSQFVYHKQLLGFSLFDCTQKVYCLYLFKLSNFSDSQVLTVLLQHLLPWSALWFLLFLWSVIFLPVVGDLEGLWESLVAELVGGWLHFTAGRSALLWFFPAVRSFSSVQSDWFSLAFLQWFWFFALRLWIFAFSLLRNRWLLFLFFTPYFLGILQPFCQVAVLIRPSLNPSQLPRFRKHLWLSLDSIIRLADTRLASIIDFCGSALFDVYLE